MADGLLSSKDFAARIRAKYPGAYDHVSDDELTQRVIKKYPSYGGQVQLAPPGLPDVTPKELRRGQTMTPSGPMPYGQAVAAGPNVPAGQAEAAMGFGRPAGDIARTSAQSVAQAANVAAPIFTGGMSLPLQSAIQAGTGGLETATEGGSLKDIGKSAAIGAAIPPVAEGLAAGAGAALKAIRGPVARNIPQALKMAEGSKKMGQAVRDVEGARPYLGGDKPTMAEVQAKIPGAKDEVWEPYKKALDLVKDQQTGVLHPETGKPMKVGELEEERLKLSAQTRDLKSATPTDRQGIMQKDSDLAALANREQEVKGALDQKLSATGIDPQAIRRVHGNIKGIERSIGERVSEAEKLRPYGISKLVPRWAGGAGFHPIEGAKDILAGKPFISGAPSDVAFQQLFREGAPKTNFGTPIRPVSGGSQSALEPLERRQYVRPIMTGEPGEPARPQPASEPAPYERRTPEQTKADIQAIDPGMAQMEANIRGQARNMEQRYPINNYPTALQPYGEGLLSPPEENTPDSFYRKYGQR